ncbi:choice-of-anchor I family protein [Gimesia maris]|uniref:choice-of-anchor I family protein n=1 Tax=Gimesia maris TaxID=122 RepID=UPI0030DC7930
MTHLAPQSGAKPRPCRLPAFAVIILGVFSFIVSGCSDTAGKDAVANNIKPNSGEAGEIADPLPEPPAASKAVGLKFLGRYRHGTRKKSTAEICAFDTDSKRLFVVDGERVAVDILDITNPSEPQLFKSVDLAELGSKPNSITAKGGVIAAALSSDPKQEPGLVVFLSPAGEVLKTVHVGPEPDMLTISPDGHWLITANEGEATKDYTRNPEGSVSLIDLTDGVAAVTDASVVHIDFTAYNDKSKLPSGVRVFGKNATPAQDFEPEYIAVSPDSKTAWVSLQEANAFAIIDLETSKLVDLVPLGYKDHSLPENAFDASNKDKKIQLRTWPVKGMYQPDAIYSFEVDGTAYVITADEGDHRDFDGFSEKARVGDLKLDPKKFPNAKELQSPKALGRLMVTSSNGDADGDGLYEEIYCFGGRSFSIRSAEGQLIYNNGNEFERIIANRFPKSFNADHESNDLDDRSDNKGPEPEGLVVGMFEGRPVAFIGMERHSGIMIYDLTNPKQPVFCDYVITRDFDKSTKKPEAGDLGPEGLTFIPADVSPTGKPLLAVSYEISGTTALFEVVSNTTTEKQGQSLE